MSEPRPIPDVAYCGVRGAEEADGTEMLHLECRFSDGQKYAAIQLYDDEIGNVLAHKVADFLNAEARKLGYVRHDDGAIFKEEVASPWSKNPPTRQEKDEFWWWRHDGEIDVCLVGYRSSQGFMVAWVADGSEMRYVNSMGGEWARATPPE